ncbi:MAG: hypothetical protein MJ231_05680, partial [bacterium]|nr:hypothetical protein [bacterium]
NLLLYVKSISLLLSRTSPHLKTLSEFLEENLQASSMSYIKSYSFKKLPNSGQMLQNFYMLNEVKNM